MTTAEPQSSPAPAPHCFDETQPNAGAGSKPGPGRRQLGLLGLVLACGAGVGFAALKSGPQSASASAPSAPAAASGEIEFLAADAAAVRRMEQSLQDAGRISEDGRFSPASTQVPVTELKTNPFRPRVASVPPVEMPDVESAESRMKEAERQATLHAVQSPQLQSILRGDSHRACLINNTLYQEGQRVDGFVVEEIALTSVVVHKGVYRFELKMTK